MPEIHNQIDKDDAEAWGKELEEKLASLITNTNEMTIKLYNSADTVNKLSTAMTNNNIAVGTGYSRTMHYPSSSTTWYLPEDEKDKLRKQLMEAQIRLVMLSRELEAAVELLAAQRDLPIEECVELIQEVGAAREKAKVQAAIGTDPIVRRTEPIYHTPPSSLDRAVLYQEAPHLDPWVNEV